MRNESDSIKMNIKKDLLYNGDLGWDHKDKDVEYRYGGKQFNLSSTQV